VLLQRMGKKMVMINIFQFLKYYNNIEKIWRIYLSPQKSSSSTIFEFPILGKFCIMKKNKPPFKLGGYHSTTPSFFLSSFLFPKSLPSPLPS
jgi:hypothetical protein